MMCNIHLWNSGYSLHHHCHPPSHLSSSSGSQSSPAFHHPNCAWPHPLLLTSSFRWRTWQCLVTNIYFYASDCLWKGRRNKGWELRNWHNLGDSKSSSLKCFYSLKLLLLHFQPKQNWFGLVLAIYREQMSYLFEYHENSDLRWCLNLLVWFWHSLWHLHLLFLIIDLFFLLLLFLFFFLFISTCASRSFLAFIIIVRRLWLSSFLARSFSKPFWKFSYKKRYYSKVLWFLSLHLGLPVHSSIFSFQDFSKSSAYRTSHPPSYSLRLSS